MNQGRRQRQTHINSMPPMNFSKVTPVLADFSHMTPAGYLRLRLAEALPCRLIAISAQNQSKIGCWDLGVVLWTTQA